MPHCNESEKASLGSSRSLRIKSNLKPNLVRVEKAYETLNNELASGDLQPHMTVDQKQFKHMISSTAALRRQFLSPMTENAEPIAECEVKIYIQGSESNMSKSNEQLKNEKVEYTGLLSSNESFTDESSKL